MTAGSNAFPGVNASITNSTARSATAACREGCGSTDTTSGLSR
jgi:hypothetical protein